MDVEIQVAVQFIISFLNEKFSKKELDVFKEELRSLLLKKFDGHWYPEKPAKGSAYRCLSIENHIDNVLLKAAEKSALDIQILCQTLPKKLDLWIDPSEVSYRIGKFLILDLDLIYSTEKVTRYFQTIKLVMCNFYFASSYVLCILRV